MTVAVGTLLIDTFPVRLDLTEDKETGKVIMRGIFGRVDVPTSNGRIYPRKLMEREIKRLSAAIKRRKVIGETDHPADGKSKLTRTSHVITVLRLQEDGYVYGEAEVLNTSSGRDLKEILKAGVEVGVSSRGIGSTRSVRGHDIVQEDFQLVTWDVVADPAVKDATPKVFIEENEMDAEQWDAKKLREKFPGLVREIEEDAQKVGSAKAEETFQAVLDDKATAIAEKMKPKLQVELRSIAEKDLRDEFALKLMKKIGEMRSEFEEQVRSEMQSDPRVAKERVAFERVMSALQPFFVPKGSEEVVKEWEDRTSDLETKLQERQTDLDTIKAKLDETSEKAKEMGYLLYVERRITGLENAQVIREMVGGVLQYDSVDALEKKIDSSIKATEEQQEKLVQAKAANDVQRHRMEQRTTDFQKQIDSKLAELQGAIKDRDDKIVDMEEALEKSANIGKEGWIRAYTEETIRNHPEAPRMRKLIEKTKPKTREEVDALLESFDEPIVADRDLRSQIRSHMGRGQETVTEGQTKTTAHLKEEVIPGSGTTFEEVLWMSGQLEAEE